jgi:hypothetical protein
MTTKLNDLRALIPTKTITITPTNPPRAHGKYVYQRVAKGVGNVVGYPHRALQLRRHVIPYDPKTSKQIRQRTHFKNAVTAWHAASESERSTAHAVAEQKNTTLFTAYISKWMKENPLPQGTLWDGGSTVWDSGATVWDV